MSRRPQQSACSLGMQTVPEKEEGVLYAAASAPVTSS